MLLVFWMSILPLLYFKPPTELLRLGVIHLTYYLNRVKTLFGNWFACASIAVPACCRICARVSEAVSAAKSASWMRLRELVRFSAVVCRLAIAELKRV